VIVRVVLVVVAERAGAATVTLGAALGAEVGALVAGLVSGLSACRPLRQDRARHEPRVRARNVAQHVERLRRDRPSAGAAVGHLCVPVGHVLREARIVSEGCDEMRMASSISCASSSRRGWTGNLAVLAHRRDVARQWLESPRPVRCAWRAGPRGCWADRASEARVGVVDAPERSPPGLLIDVDWRGRAEHRASLIADGAFLHDVRE
jgi:hypothetical protein